LLFHKKNASRYGSRFSNKFHQIKFFITIKQRKTASVLVRYGSRLYKKLAFKQQNGRMHSVMNVQHGGFKYFVIFIVPWTIIGDQKNFLPKIVHFYFCQKLKNQKKNFFLIYTHPNKYFDCKIKFPRLH
jgi:hypothetical protein